MKQPLQKVYHSILQNTEKPCFVINNNTFRYRDLQRKISAIQHLIRNAEKHKPVGIITNDDLETYAAILSCIFLGIAFVPVDPSHPDERNINIMNQAGLSRLLCSNASSLSKNFLAMCRDRLISTGNLPENGGIPVFMDSGMDSTAYILFTSGSTGIPKGVPISRGSLTSFLDDFFNYGWQLGSGDKFLQVFDLTFDLSIFSYLVPLSVGASIYTIPKKEIRYSYAFNLLEDEEITCALSVPSFIGFLQPYFEQIHLPKVKYWWFCGEALKKDQVEGWQKSLPNASLFNVYGPTEATIFCTVYPCTNDNHSIKDHNGVVSIGKPFPGVELLIADEHGNPVPAGETGELCLAGLQNTPGYLNNPSLNEKAFFVTAYHEKRVKFYRTGDLCFSDSEGDFQFAGRKDSQVKIQGFRVELGEIENCALGNQKVKEAIAIVQTDSSGKNSIELCISPPGIPREELVSHLKRHLPEYMMPREIHEIDTIPLNINGKTDRKAIKQMIESSGSIRN